jgi:hypothetical protein
VACDPEKLDEGQEMMNGGTIRWWGRVNVGHHFDWEMLVVEAQQEVDTSTGEGNRR